MRKSLLTYVKPHVQEDPLSMILGIAYIGAMMEQEGLPVELCDERLSGDAHMREVIDRNDIIGFGALTPNIRRAIAWANRAYCAAVGADLDTVVRDSIEFVPGAAPKQSRALAAMARQTGAAQTDQRRFAVAGEWRTYEITEIPLSGDETAGIVRDVTGREDA